MSLLQHTSMRLLIEGWKYCSLKINRVLFRWKRTLVSGPLETRMSKNSGIVWLFVFATLKSNKSELACTLDIYFFILVTDNCYSLICDEKVANHWFLFVFQTLFKLIILKDFFLLILFSQKMLFFAHQMGNVLF